MATAYIPVRKFSDCFVPANCRNSHGNPNHLPYSGVDPVHDWARVVDCFDAPLTWLDNRVALKTLDQAHRAISGRSTAHPEISTIPRIVTLGGDHTTTLSALRSTYKRWGQVSVIHFDSHIGEIQAWFDLAVIHEKSLTFAIDTWDPEVLGKGYNWPKHTPLLGC